MSIVDGEVNELTEDPGRPSLYSPLIAAYNVVNFGARGDGRTDSTAAFLWAWMSACSSASPATVYVSRGNFLIRAASFSGPCRSRIQFQIDGTLVAPDNYYVIGNSGFWILFYKVSRLTISGGTIDTRGNEFWSCRKNGNNCPAGARSMMEFDLGIFPLVVSNVIRARKP
ncbi:polygalacturonase-like [Coffea arabica]|uniref:Polygalacturonase-like n=1 Tax=Coffea arabica TaxID=13443 RepID=A0A6P6XHV7_COFAR|nr:polygalacturonase-like [Coffea arabica]